jgi:hypothetical protein
VPISIRYKQLLDRLDRIRFETGPDDRAFSKTVSYRYLASDNHQSAASRRSRVLRSSNRRRRRVLYNRRSQTTYQRSFKFQVAYNHKRSLVQVLGYKYSIVLVQSAVLYRVEKLKLIP